MKQTKKVGMVLFLFLFMGFMALHSEALSQDGLRILTYNVRNCRGLDNYSVINTERIGQVIADQAPDIVGLQELDQKTTRSEGRDIIKELAKGVRMVPSYGAAINYQGGQYGIGILSREKPLSTRSVPLPGKEESRVLLIAEFDRYVFFNTHFSLTAESREESVEIINAERQKYNKPVILVGDLNATPDSPVILKLNQNWTQASGNQFTFSADNPHQTIDYVFVHAPNGKTVTVKSSQVVEEPVASDHRPVLTVIELP